MNRIFPATAAGLLLAACSTDGSITAPGATPGGGPRLGANTPVTGAAFTTVNEDVDEDGHCKNGNPNTNCNIYDGKEFVWLNGGPSTAYVGDGTYFFAVLAPGGQPNPNDGGAKLLSSDSYKARTFTVSGSGTSAFEIAYSGTHDKSGNKIRLLPYDDTPNKGGVYIMAICSLAGGYPVEPSDCKYDAFKIVERGTTPAAEGPTVEKDAAGSYTQTYKWQISKGARTPTVNQFSGNASVTYDVVVSRDAANDQISAIGVSGKIRIQNPNPANITGVTIADQLTGGSAQTCTVTGAASPVVIGPGEAEFDYSCDLSGLTALPEATKNKVTISWDAQTIGGLQLAAGSANFETPTAIAFTSTPINATVSVTDLFNNGGTAVPISTLVGSGASSTVTLAEAPKTFTYTRSIPVTANTCVTYPNLATITETGQSANASVRICGGIANGNTLGYWSNNNGGNTLCTRDPAWRYLMNGGNPAVPYLRNANAAFYTVPTSGKCASAHSNFSTWLLAANSTNMSNMLSAQLAATTLNVNYKGMDGMAFVAHPLTRQPATINSIIADAVSFLRANANGNTTASGTPRDQATAYKNLFDALNNNLVFAVPTPTP